MAKKILCVFGTRPEAVKMAPVVRALEGAKGRLRVSVCVTAQHRALLDDVLRVFSVRPRWDLGVMRENQTLSDLTRRVVGKIPPVLEKAGPDLVLVHGDTASMFLTALACFHHRVPVGHVEAGLRSFDIGRPFPEEANRRLGDAVSSVHFAPTRTAKENLLRANIPASNIYVTGNTVVDALLWAAGRPHRFANARLRYFLRSAVPARARLAVLTAHRRENFGRPMKDVFSAVRAAAGRFPGLRFVYPVHPNPNVRLAAEKALSGHDRILLLPPLSYLDFCGLLKRSDFVVTDSGGLQEEAPSLGKPVLVLRDVTERPEAVKAGTARLVGTGFEKVLGEISRLVREPETLRRMSGAVNPYGDGRAAARVRDGVLHYFGMGPRPKDFSRI